MGGNRDGLAGTTADIRTDTGSDRVGDVFGDGSPPGIRVDNPIPLDVQRIIASVAKDWDPTPNLTTTPEIVVNGTTLLQVYNQLNAHDEWGQAGGMLRTDVIPAGNSTNLTVHLHGNLRYRLPRWSNYGNASSAAQAEWDKMFAKLRAHEDRHLAIAIEEGNTLASDLVGHDIADIAQMVTAANARMAKRQKQLDDDTDHGAKENVQYGDVILDTSIT